MPGRGSGNVVGGVLGAISMSDETETSGLQQPGQHSKPIRVLETKQKCIRVNRMECDTNSTDHIDARTSRPRSMGGVECPGSGVIFFS